MTNKQEDIDLLKSCGALLEGHFLLSSGLHSQYYIQCAKIFANHQYASAFCTRLAIKLQESLDLDKIDAVVSPAMGGILVGYELARHLDKPNYFVERVNNIFELRRGFDLSDTPNILVVEDVITTGKSSLEAYKAIRANGGNIVAEASIIKRDQNLTELDDVPLISLIELNFPTYKADELPVELKNIPAIKPGSRKITS